MKYDFETAAPRRGTNCMKWDMLLQQFGREDILPLWVADMEFFTAPEIVEALQKAARQAVYGYPVTPKSLPEAVARWQKVHHNWDISPTWVCFAHGVVPGMSFAIQALTKPNEGIIIQTPVYGHFYNSIRLAGRNIVKNQLIREGNRYTMNFSQLEELITPECHTLILCSPHNPVGRVWTYKELEKLADIASRKNLTVISDEIHQDIVYSDAKHTCLASVPGMEDRTLTLVAPNKTFNIAGLQTAAVIAKNEKLRNAFLAVATRYHMEKLNVLGMAAMEAAFTKGDNWYGELIKVLEDNRDFTEEFVRNQLSGVRMDHMEGTFVLWLDFRGCGFNNETVTDFLVNKAKVGLNSGISFGEEGDGFARINIACPKTMLADALERIKSALAAEGIE